MRRKRRQQERAGRGARPVVQVREDERPVEQEAGQHEEDGDAAVHPGEERRRGCSGLFAPLGERDVGEHDRERGERAQPVEAREMAVGGGGRRVRCRAAGAVAIGAGV